MSRMSLSFRCVIPPGRMKTVIHWNLICFLKRNLNNAFAYDLVPSPSVVAAALKAARRVNDFATAVRIFEGTLSSRVLRTGFFSPHCIIYITQIVEQVE